MGQKRFVCCRNTLATIRRYAFVTIFVKPLSFVICAEVDITRNEYQRKVLFLANYYFNKMWYKEVFSIHSKCCLSPQLKKHKGNNNEKCIIGLVSQLYFSMIKPVA